MFINKYKQLNIIKYLNRFLKKIKAIKFYLGEFKKDNFIKLKIYLKKITKLKV